MKIHHLFLYTLLLTGLTADSLGQMPAPVAKSNSSVMRLNAQNYLSELQEPLPLWLQLMFPGVSPPTAHAPAVETMLPVISPEPEPEPEPSKPVYVYGDVVPESPEVEGVHFAKTAIIGDSRSQGLMAYGDLGGGANMTGLGLSVYNIWDKAYVETGGGSLTCLQALERDTYEAVYIGLGANCLGYLNVEKFYSNYCRLVDEIRLRQPNAVIYVQNIIPVNEPILRGMNYAECFNNDAVRQYNEYIKRIAQEKNLYYLDLYTLFLDETGQLPRDAGGDGLHLTVSYTKIWAEYLRTHIIDPEVYDVVSAQGQELSLGVEGIGEEVYLEEGSFVAS